MLSKERKEREISPLSNAKAAQVLQEGEEFVETKLSASPDREQSLRIEDQPNQLPFIGSRAFQLSSLRLEDQSET